VESPVDHAPPADRTGLPLGWLPKLVPAMNHGKLTVLTLRVSCTGTFHSLWIIDSLCLVGLTIGTSGRRFNQLTCGQSAHILLSRRFVVLRGRASGPRRAHYEQENLPAEQPSSRQGARLPSAHAYPRRTRHPGRSSSQGPHRTLRLIARPFGTCWLTPTGSLQQTTIGVWSGGVRVLCPPTP
jgi:hypothetical protein